MNNEAQRAAFEAWAKSTFRYICLHRYEHPQYDGDPLPYKSSMCDAAWRAWQAAIEHARLNPQADTQLATTHVPAP